MSAAPLRQERFADITAAGTLIGTRTVHRCFGLASARTGNPVEIPQLATKQKSQKPAIDVPVGLAIVGARHADPHRSRGGAWTHDQRCGAVSVP